MAQGNGNEATCELGCGLNNALGHAEKLDVSGEISSERSNQFAVTYEQPRAFGGLPVTFNARFVLRCNTGPQPLP